MTIGSSVQQLRPQRWQKRPKLTYLTTKKSTRFAHFVREFLYISKPVSSYPACEITCFEVVRTTWSFDDKISFFFIFSVSKPLGIIEEGESEDKREGVDGQEGVNVAASAEMRDGVTEDLAAKREVSI